jgi:uncharacterized protein YggE
MRNKITLSLIGILTIAVLFVFVGTRPAFTAAPRQSVDGGELHTITVSGSGTVSLTPDVASISIGVQTEDKEASKAVAANNTKAQGVLAKLKTFGIPEKDINTTNFAVYPRVQYDDKGQPLETTYVVENTVLVKVKDLTKIGEILDTVVKAGANTISNIQFDVADSSAAYDKAMQAAVADARSKADVAAKAAGVRVGQVHSIQTSTSSPSTPFKRGVMAESAAAAPDVPIAPGQLDIVVDVTIVYLIGG